MSLYELTVKTHFDAAHRLEHYKGKCNSLHGHRFNVTIVIVGDELDENGLLIDFALLKKVVSDNFDHTYLNESLNMDDPTAERIAKRIYELITPEFTRHLNKIRTKLPKVKYVEVWESPECSVKYNVPDVK
jgi:6-pyruvoyltetrahydropterin/6-carboxytetrahydropterin synthase